MCACVFIEPVPFVKNSVSFYCRLSIEIYRPPNTKRKEKKNSKRIQHTHETDTIQSEQVIFSLMPKRNDVIFLVLFFSLSLFLYFVVTSSSLSLSLFLLLFSFLLLLSAWNCCCCCCLFRWFLSCIICEWCLTSGSNHLI